MDRRRHAGHEGRAEAVTHRVEHRQAQRLAVDAVVQGGPADFVPALELGVTTNRSAAKVSGGSWRQSISAGTPIGLALRARLKVSLYCPLLTTSSATSDARGDAASLSATASPYSASSSSTPWRAYRSHTRVPSAPVITSVSR